MFFEYNFEDLWKIKKAFFDSLGKYQKFSVPVIS